MDPIYTNRSTDQRLVHRLFGLILSYAFNLLSSSLLTANVGLAMGLVTATGIVILRCMVDYVLSRNASQRGRYPSLLLAISREELFSAKDTSRTYVPTRQRDTSRWRRYSKCGSLEPQSMPLLASSGATLYIFCGVSFPFGKY